MGLLMLALLPSPNLCLLRLSYRWDGKSELVWPEAYPRSGFSFSLRQQKQSSVHRSRPEREKFSEKLLLGNQEKTTTEGSKLVLLPRSISVLKQIQKLS